MARVLVVDDDQDLTNSYSRLLKLCGHECRKAYDGQSVLQQALAFQPHAVLLDIGLPKLSGYDVARKLRQYQALTEVKIVAITGSAGADEIQRVKEAGFDEFFRKPVNNDLLIAYLGQFSFGPVSQSPAIPSPSLATER